MSRVPLALCLAALAVLAGCTGSVPFPDSGGNGPTAGPSATPTTAGDGARVTVVRVVDGDTMEVRFANGTADTVRLLGVDTPEVHSSNTPGEFEGVPDTEAGERCLGRYGERASAFAEDRLAGETARLRFDPESDRRGYYGRLLGYLVVDGESFNFRLLDEGLARVYESTFTERERFREAEAAARSARAGLWACANDTDAGATATATVGTGSSDGRIEVVEVRADAPGDDNENLDEEYVVLENTGAEPLELSGWTVSDGAGHVYEFGERTLDPGERVTLYTGSGTDNRTAVYWGRSSAVWNNDGDTVTVRDTEGDVAAERSY